MRRTMGISALALGVALATGPASAQLLNLNGDAPLIDLGSPGNPGVSVNLNSDVGVNVDLGNTPDVTVDLNGETSGDLTVDLPLGDSGDGIGNVVDLDGSDGDIGIDLDSSNGDNDIDLGLTNDDTVYVDLFGDDALGDNLLGDGVGDVVDLNDADVIGDLFGDGVAGDNAVGLDVLDDIDIDANGLLEEGVDIGDLNVPVLDNGVSVGDVGLDGVLGGDVIPGLFGEGGSVDVLDLSSLDLGGLDLLNLDEILSLGQPQPAANDGSDGVNGRDGQNGDDGMTTVVIVNPPLAADDTRVYRYPGIVEPVGSVGSSSGDTTIINNTSRRTVTNRATARVATTAKVAAAPTSCFTPNDEQIEHLVTSRSYTDASVASWQQARAVNIVPVRLCPEARVKVAEVAYADANMAMMRAGIERNAAIARSLSGKGIGTDDVLAVDSKGGAVTVYIY